MGGFGLPYLRAPVSRPGPARVPASKADGQPPADDARTDVAARKGKG